VLPGIHPHRLLPVMDACVVYGQQNILARWVGYPAAGFSGQKGGTQILTRLIVKLESGGCCDHVDGSASCCMMRSREEYRTNSWHYAVFYSWGHQCGGLGMNYLTHTHTIVCAHNTISPRMYSVCSGPLACCCAESRHTLTPLCSSHLHFATALSLFIRLWRMEGPG